MTPRDSVREPGRPTLLDPKVEEKLVEATEIGAPMGIAAEYVGISKRTFEDWMRRGNNEQQARESGEDPNEVEQKYLDLYVAIRQARSKASVTSAALIRKSAVGGQVTERTTRKFRDHDGQVVEEVTEKRSTGDWRAAAWWLERQERGDFGKESKVTQEITGEVGVKVNLGELAARVTEQLGELTASTRKELDSVPAGSVPGGDSGEVRNVADLDVVDAVIEND